MRLIGFLTNDDDPPKIIPAPSERVWMDNTPQAFAYRCLPLNIANAHGWLILNPVPFTAEWNGTDRLDGIDVRPLDNSGRHSADSHFGCGVLTFSINALFRTEPGYDLMVTGPSNMFKDSIQALSGVVETDWAPFTFTMNWKFTRANTPVTFERDEPFCMIYPVRRGLIDEVEPEFRAIDTDEELYSRFLAWSAARGDFNKELRVPTSDASAQKWQKDYFRGGARFAQAPSDHRTKLRPRPFALPRRWRQDSLLDQLLQDQTDENRTGRQRLREGVLESGPETVWITPDMDIDPDAFDFVCQPDFLTAEECAQLAVAASVLPGAEPLTVAEGACLESHIVSLPVVERDRPDAAALMRDAQRRITERLTQFYDLTAPLFTDSIHLIRLPEGVSVDPHAERANADGSPNPASFRDFAAIVFLNDCYQGGEVYFVRANLVVRPRKGMLLAFTAGWPHEHARLEIMTGTQLTMSTFHTFNARRRSPELYTENQQPAI